MSKASPKKHISVRIAPEILRRLERIREEQNLASLGEAIELSVRLSSLTEDERAAIAHLRKLIK